MKKYNIPTAKYETFSDYESAKAYVETCDIPVVLKADGLALGKGVLICTTREEALDGVKEMMLDKKFGQAGSKVVVEEFLEGPEVSCLAFTDGKTMKPMITSCDHKRAKDNDEGLNTGGMGTFSPAPFFGENSAKEVMEKIMLPTMYAMNAENRPFKGVLYFGLMKTKDGYKTTFRTYGLGEHKIELVGKSGKKIFSYINVSLPFNELVEKRVDYIINKQQYHKEGSALDGAFLIYDTEEGKPFFSNVDPDLNGTRERLAMGYIVAVYLQRVKNEKYLVAFKKYINFLLREIFDEVTGEEE